MLDKKEGMGESIIIGTFNEFNTVDHRDEKSSDIIYKDLEMRRGTTQTYIQINVYICT